MKSFWRLLTTTGPILAMLAMGVLPPSNSHAEESDAGSTPTAMKPGAPAGSYALTGFENINYYNGSLNFSLPLHAVQGRGTAAMTVTLAIEQHWSVKSTSQGDPKPGIQWWSDWLPGYGPGILLGRKVADGNVCGDGTFQQTSVTRLTFTSADRTEYDLRDVLYDGQPLRTECNTNIPQRGTDFATADGSSATFRSDVVIRDGIVNNQGSTATVFRPSGYLMLRDGTRYRIDNGLVTWVRDRNGNRLAFLYYEDGATKPRVTRITDSLNRTVVFQYLAGQDVITFKGFGGTQRNIIVYRTNLANAFRPGSGYQVRSLSYLFPGLTFLSDLNNPIVAAGVSLPNGQAYTFYYNEYAELEDVYLPTGGRFHYTYQAGVRDGDGGESGWFTGSVRLAIYRRLKDRTVYGNSGVELVTRISRPDTMAGTDGFVDTDQYDPQNNLLRKERHFFYGRAASSLDLRMTAYPSWKDGKEYRTEVRKSAGGLVRRTDNTWEQRAPVAWWTGPADDAPSKDPRITATITELDNGTFSWRTFAYDTYNNRTRVAEYAFNALPTSTPVRRTDTDFLTTNGNPPVNYATDLSVHIRDLPSRVRVYRSDGTLAATTTYEYDVYTGDGHAALEDRPNISGLDPAFTTGLTTRGNLTASMRSLDNPGGTITTYRQYDVAGNIVAGINGRGYATRFEFFDRFGAPDGNARLNASAPELDEHLETSYAFMTSTQNAKGHTTYTQFDFYLGRPVDHEDANGVVDSTWYNDSLDRTKQASRGQASLTRFEYADAPPNPRVHTYSDRATLGDGKIHRDVYFDSFGREISKLVFEAPDTETSYIVVDARIYDALGRVKTSYSPFRTSDTSTHYATSMSYDELDRPTGTVAPDAAATTIAYAGNVTTTTDPAGKLRRSVVDSLGRIVGVTEDPDGLNYTTNYFYDVFDDVVRVVQGTQVRTFGYDSLGRLLCASTPEARTGTPVPDCTAATLPTTGVDRYSYDANDNLTGRTDARGVSASFSYDELDRILVKSYSGGTPATSFGYDGAPRGIGRFWYYSSLVGGQNWGTANDEYDALGRVTKSHQLAADVVYPFEYSYDLAGNLTSEKYPTGRVITTTYDMAGRERSVGEGSYLYGNVPTDADYAAHGAILNLKLGASGVNRWRVTKFNCRLQQGLAGLGSAAATADLAGLGLQYGTSESCAAVAGDPANNGSLLHQKIFINSLTSPRFTQDYTYDGASRLATAAETHATAGQLWIQNYGYDRWGNRTLLPGSYVPTSRLTPTSFDPATNRISDTGWSYDEAGNLTRDGLARTFAYDAENRQVTAQNTTYVYDGEGRRVRKIVDGASRIYIYDALGRLAAEYGTANAYLETRFVLSDQLGSTRLTMNGRGDVVTRHDYLPFGEELSSNFFRSDYGSDQSVRHRFGGKERDLETGLDFFKTRYLSGPQGRFTSPDPFSAMADIDDAADRDRYLQEPRNWNRYAYVWDAPLNYIDPYGERVYVVAYTQGNSHGDAAFRRVAETHAQRIMARKGFDPKRDTVVLSAVTDKRSFAAVIAKANGLEQQFGKVQQVTLISHSGWDGPVFPGNPRQSDQWFSQAEFSKTALSINWAEGARANFYGCNSAAQFCQKFANQQGVATWGFDVQSSISGRPDAKSKWYLILDILNPTMLDPMFPGGPLYMVGTDGRGPVRRTPAPSGNPRR